MSIFVAVLFMIICWVIGLLVFANFGIAAPQYGSDKFKRNYYIKFVLSLVVLFIGLPGLGFYIAL